MVKLWHAVTGTKSLWYEVSVILVWCVIRHWTEPVTRHIQEESTHIRLIYVKKTIQNVHKRMKL